MKQHLPKEDLLHYIWKMMRIDLQSLVSTCGKAIHVFDTGFHNVNAGPDFLEAKIKIGETLWVGNVEIHIKSSDWLKHKHQNDPAYDNVIAHVVYEHDKEILNNKGFALPTIVLKDRIDSTLINKHLNLIHSENWIPCEKLIDTFPKGKITFYLERLMIERLENKVAILEQLYQQTNQNWEATLYHLLAINFGFKVNAHAFKRLAEVTPYSVVSKYKMSVNKLEALFFGQSGLLQKYSDDFVDTLTEEHKFLKRKHTLKEMNISEWKFLRLRPANFPTIRIAQFCRLMCIDHLFQKIKEHSELNSIYKLLDIELNGYWQSHYSFKSSSKAKTKRLGKSSIDLLIINVIVPIIFFYGKKTKDENYINRALDILKMIKPEKNSVSLKWKALGVEIKSACDTQALYHLKNVYCNEQKCLNCQIGNHIMLLNHSADLV